MTNPKKQIEKLLASAKDTLSIAAADIETARELIQEFYEGHSEKWQESEKGQSCQSVIDGLDEVSQAIESAFDTEPDMTEL